MLNPILFKLANKFVKLSGDRKKAQKPPGLRDAGLGAPASCGGCKYFVLGGPLEGNLCHKYLYQVEKTQVCDSFQPKSLDLPPTPAISPGGPITGEGMGQPILVPKMAMEVNQTDVPAHNQNLGSEGGIDSAVGSSAGNTGYVATPGKIDPPEDNQSSAVTPQAVELNRGNLLKAGQIAGIRALMCRVLSKLPR